jgi:hypothetical protein
MHSLSVVEAEVLNFRQAHVVLLNNGSMQRQRCAAYWPAQRLKINAALVPPKPKEFESA